MSDPTVSPAIPTPVPSCGHQTLFKPRCERCGRAFALILTVPFEMRCQRCKAVCRKDPEPAF